jgi:flagellar hook-associated protein 3 FlgL
MISGLQANTPSFLASLSNLENRLSKVNQEMTSGIRVNRASDDPSAVAPIIAYQGRIDYIKQIQANLTQAQAEVQTADSALQQASTLINQLITLGAQGASSTSDGATRAILAQKVQALEQQLVSIANTAINGHYTFGGDDLATAPYAYNGSGPNGVVQNNTAANTQVLRDSDGNTITPRMTAQAIFDSPGASIFKAAFDLATALTSNNQAGIQTALNDVKTSADQLNAATTTYGNIETWITQGLTTATSHVNNLTQALSSFKDADIAADATELSLDQTAMQAAIAANGSLRTKSLFDYLG